MERRLLLAGALPLFVLPMHHPRRARPTALFFLDRQQRGTADFFSRQPALPLCRVGRTNALAWYRSNADVFIPLRCVSTAGSCLSGWGSCMLAFPFAPKNHRSCVPIRYNLGAAFRVWLPF
jgi:hypothetical protein